MRTILATLVMMMGVSAFANEPAAPVAAAPVAATAEPMKAAKADKKMMRKVKHECRKSGKKGAELKACVDEKMKM
jgi:hypothetical protein